MNIASWRPPTTSAGAAIEPTRSMNEVAHAASSVPSSAARRIVAASSPKRSSSSGAIGFDA